MKNDPGMPPRQPSRWDFLDYFNTASFKGWSVGWLWIYTGVVWGVGCFLHQPPTEWLLAWLGGLTAYSGVSYIQYKAMRDSDYGNLDRQAEIARAKAGGPAPQTTVQAAQANVSTGETK